MVAEGAILERAKSLANEAVWAVALQRRRLRSKEAEDDRFVIDLQFLVVALRRLRRAAELAARVDEDVTGAIKAFDNALPGLHVMRNVGEHIDSYAVDSPKRHHKDVERFALQVGSFDGTVYRWLDRELDIDTALVAANELFAAVTNTVTKRISAPGC